MLCREQVAELRPHVDAIRAAGGALVVVGNGAPMFARAFREDLGLDAAVSPDHPPEAAPSRGRAGEGVGSPPFRGDPLSGVTVLVDESLRTYALLGFRRDLGGITSLRVAMHGARALAKGFRQGRTMGDAMQLGGVVVVRPGGAVAYAYASREAGDHPPPGDVVAAVRRAAP